MNRLLSEQKPTFKKQKPSCSEMIGLVKSDKRCVSEMIHLSDLVNRRCSELIRLPNSSKCRYSQRIYSTNLVKSRVVAVVHRRAYISALSIRREWVRDFGRKLAAILVSCCGFAWGIQPKRIYVDTPVTSALERNAVNGLGELPNFSFACKRICINDPDRTIGQFD